MDEPEVQVIVTPPDSVSEAQTELETARIEAEVAVIEATTEATVAEAEARTAEAQNRPERIEAWQTELQSQIANLQTQVQELTEAQTLMTNTLADFLLSQSQAATVVVTPESAAPVGPERTDETPVPVEPLPTAPEAPKKKRNLFL